MRLTVLFLLFAVLCLFGSAFSRRKRPQRIPKSEYSAAKENFAPSCALNKRKGHNGKHRALTGVDFAQLSQDFFAERAKAGQTAENFWKTPTDRNMLLTYAGAMCRNQLKMDKLPTALEHLNAEVVQHDDVVKMFNYVRDWRGLPNGTYGDREEDEPVDFDGESAMDRGAEHRRRHFVRRMTWLYPHDSCFLRAELVARLAEHVLTVKPRTLHKIYVFGNLRANSKYAKKGFVEWGYHVAVLVNDDKLGFVVMDAALHPEGPLPLNDWLALMSPEGCDSCYKAGFVLTNRFVFWPVDNCDEIVSVFDEWQGISDPQSFYYFSNMLKEYLDNEWENMIDLGKNPAKLLATY